MDASGPGLSTVIIGLVSLIATVLVLYLVSKARW